MKNLLRWFLAALLGLGVSEAARSGETALRIGYMQDRTGAAPQREFEHDLGDGVNGPPLDGLMIRVRHVPMPGRACDFTVESLSGSDETGELQRRYMVALHHWSFPMNDALAVSLGMGLGHFAGRIESLHEGHPLSVSEGRELFLALAAGAELSVGDRLSLALAYDHQESVLKKRTEMDKRFSIEAAWRWTEAWRIAAGYHDDDWSNGTTLSLIHDF